MIFQTAAASTAVPQEVLSRVVSTAKTEVENLASCDKIAGVARLRARQSRVVRVGPRHKSLGALRGARAERRRGHRHEHAAAWASVVFGKGTFEAAKEAWTTLALGFADRAEVGEAAIFRGAGAKLAGINWLHGVPGAHFRERRRDGGVPLRERLIRRHTKLR